MEVRKLPHDCELLKHLPWFRGKAPYQVDVVGRLALIVRPEALAFQFDPAHPDAWHVGFCHVWDRETLIGATPLVLDKLRELRTEVVEDGPLSPQEQRLFVMTIGIVAAMWTEGCCAAISRDRVDERLGYIFGPHGESAVTLIRAGARITYRNGKIVA